MTNKEELARVLERIEEAREAFPFDTSLVPDEVLQGLSATFDCIAVMAQFQAMSDSEEGCEGGYGYDE